MTSNHICQTLLSDLTWVVKMAKSVGCDRSLTCLCFTAHPPQLSHTYFSLMNVLWSVTKYYRPVRLFIIMEMWTLRPLHSDRHTILWTQLTDNPPIFVAALVVRYSSIGSGSSDDVRKTPHTCINPVLKMLAGTQAYRAHTSQYVYQLWCPSASGPLSYLSLQVSQLSSFPHIIFLDCTRFSQSMQVVNGLISWCSFNTDYDIACWYNDEWCVQMVLLNQEKRFGMYDDSLSGNAPFTMIRLLCEVSTLTKPASCYSKSRSDTTHFI